MTSVPIRGQKRGHRDHVTTKAELEGCGHRHMGPLGWKRLEGPPGRSKGVGLPTPGFQVLGLQNGSMHSVVKLLTCNWS